MPKPERAPQPDPKPDQQPEPVKGYTGPEDTPNAAALSIGAVLLTMRDTGGSAPLEVVRCSLLSKHTPEETDKILATLTEQNTVTIDGGIVKLTIRGLVLACILDSSPAPFHLTVPTTGPLKGRAVDPLSTCEECGGRGMHKAQCSARRPGTATA